ncbi:MAG TPA: response regulator [Polyangium sp.]|nr:response regulator [Polyangium sp.]
MKPHVLVVDDSLTIRMDLRGALTAAGFDVTLCETKRAALALLAQQSFNAVVLDVMLPDGDGIEILQYIRLSTKESDVPIVMLSGEAEVRDRVRGLTMGADEYVGKPYNIAYFIRCLRNLCRRERSTTPPPVAIVGCRRILAVDDSPTFLTYLGRMLREDGHDVVFARSGREALDMLAVQTIDCVIVDLIMPEVDGLETIRRIRQTPGRESTPTLMLTASEDPGHQREARAAGADEFVIKAAALEIVRMKIRNLLRRKHQVAPATDTAVPPSRRSVFPRPATTAQTHARVSPMHASPSVPPGPREVQTTSRFGPLFLEVASTIGLDADRSRDSLARTFSRMNIDPRTMTHQELSRALPALRETLAMFFSSDELNPRLDALSALASRPRHASA